MADLGTTYDVALVLDSPAGKLVAAREVVQRIRLRFADTLVATDVMFLEPSLLICLLHFDAERFAAVQTADIALTAREAGFRVLKPMLLSPAEREKLYKERLSRLRFCERGISDVDPVFDVLEARITELSNAGEVDAKPDLLFTVRFTDEAEFLDAMRERGDDIGLFIRGRAVPGLGTLLPLSIDLDSGQGPLSVSGRVVAAADSRSARMGFEVQLGVDANERERVAGFIDAVRRHVAWSEQQAERSARHTVRLPIEFDEGGQTRQAFTSNVSRGGAFVEADSAPPLGATLLFRLHAVGHTRSVDIRGRVAHLLPAAAAAERGTPAGFGVQFSEHADQLRQKLDSILGSVDIPTVKRAMVVDDERFFRLFLGNILKWAGFEVLEAEDGKEAFDRLIDELVRIDVLIVDLTMPGMDGRQLIRDLREVGTPAGMVVVVVSAADLGSRERQTLLDLGADDIIHKKTAPEDILQRIEAALQAKATLGPPERPIQPNVGTAKSSASGKA